MRELISLLARVAQGAGAILLLALLGAAAVFFAMRAGHGDPALAVLGDMATPETIAAFRLKWQLNDPLLVQFWRWLSGALIGDFGASMVVATGEPIVKLVGSRLPNTLFVGAYALALALVISLIAGTISALRHGKLIDSASTSLAVLGISMPDFWLSYALIYALALGLGIFPSYGFTTPSLSLAGALYSGFLPALAIAAPMAAAFTRILRTALLETLFRDHVRVARSLGHSENFIFLHHVFRNALIPYVTVIGLQVRYLLGGTVVVERIFGVNGVGSLMVDAAFARDYPLVQACALVFLACVLLVNFAVDLICTRLDPRRA
ncbi:MAG: peptide ABC transporter [Rhizobiales bacterium PAR1]|nr:MAG: peptide ABC transporter [Rhizobiales bacterium PAR1]